MRRNLAFVVLAFVMGAATRFVSPEFGGKGAALCADSHIPS
jgi:hypothetical protein